jgi:hypothetical protein
MDHLRARTEKYFSNYGINARPFKAHSFETTIEMNEIKSNHGVPN